MENVCQIEFDDDTVMELSAKKWNQVIQMGLSVCGYLDGKHVRCIKANPCECSNS